MQYKYDLYLNLFSQLINNNSKEIMQIILTWFISDEKLLFFCSLDVSYRNVSVIEKLYARSKSVSKIYYLSSSLTS